MKFFDEYKNNDFLKDKYSNNITKNELQSNIIEEKQDAAKKIEEQIINTLENISKIKDKLKKY